MPVIFPSFSLPHLWKLSIGYSEEEFEEEMYDNDVFGVSQNGPELFQTILNASTNLKELDLRLKLRSKDLVVLLGIPLPNFTCLAVAPDSL